MLSVEVWGRTEADEELRAVRVGTSVGHRQDTLLGVRVPDLLVFEFLTVDALASSAIMICEVTALRHESFDDSVENTLLVPVVITFLHGTELTEVLSSLWDLLGKDLEDNPALLLLFSRSIFATNFNIHEGLYVFGIVLR